jgi:thioredoxin 1
MNTSLVTVLALSVVAIMALAGCKWPCCCSCNEPCCSKKSTTTTQQHAGHVIAIESQEAFDKQVMQSTKPVVVKFSATWCGACQELKPVVEHVAEGLSDTYTFVEVNINKVEKAASDFSIQGVPTMIFIKDGKEVNPDKRIVGTTDEGTIKATIEQVFGK